MLLNCGVGEDFWDALDCKEIQAVNPKGNQSWIFIGRTDAEAETPTDVGVDGSKFGHLIRRTDSLEKFLMLGNIEGGRRRGLQKMRRLDGIINSMDRSWASSGSWWLTGKPGVPGVSMGSQRVGHDWVTQLNWLNWIHLHKVEPSYHTTLLPTHRWSLHLNSY